MDDLQRRIAELSPDKQALLKRRLQERAQQAAGLLIPPREGDGPVVLSSAQQRLWFIDQLEAGLPIYNIAITLRLRGSLNKDALHDALNALVERHESLRTTFEATPDGPLQRVRRPHRVSFDQHSLLQIPEAERLDVGLRLLRKAVSHPFVLTEDVMLRACLVQTAEDDHLLALIVHHIAADGWSIDIIRQELFALYTAIVNGETPSLPPLPIQYADYAIWQRMQLGTIEMGVHLAYWRQELANIPALEMQPDRPRPPVQSHRGAALWFSLPEALTDRLKEFARRERATLFMVLLAGYKALLQRYTLQDDLAVGTPIAGRIHASIEPLIGCFVNTLVVRTDLSGTPTFRELVHRVRAKALEAYEHHDAPFDQIVEIVQPERDRSRSPLFQTMFALQNVPRRPLASPGLDVEEVQLGDDAAKFDTMWQLWESKAGLSGTITYSIDLFQASTIGRMLDYYRRFLEAALAEPDRPIGRLPLLLPDERHRLLVEWNENRAALPPARCLHQLFETQAERTPEAVALEHEAIWCYGDLDRRANQLAHLLQANGVGTGMRVALVLERSAWQVVSLLAILKVGGAFVPLDPTSPIDRLGMMIEDSEPVLVLTQAHLAEKLSALSTPLLVLETLDSNLSQYPETAVPPVVVPTDLAYVIFTSGSTGRPKGVMVTHDAVSRLMQCVQATYPLTSDDVGLMSTSFVFDVAICELFAPLIAGARLVIPPAGAEKDGALLAALIAERGITNLHAVPTLLRILVEQPAFAQCRSLRRIVSAGEVLTIDLMRRIHSLFGPILHNWYGPTEAAIYATHWACEETPSWASVPIGRPFDTVQTYVLDSFLDPVPIGLPGELYLGGVQIAAGYLHQPERTAEHFIPDPFSGEPGARLYKTGDLVRWLPNGALEYLGRLDRQVKLRGYRIEPGEIEAVLAGHTLVSKAAVQVWTAAPGDERLVAYAVPAPGVAPGEEPIERILRAYLRARLPEYMVPASIMILDQIPMLASGKLDRASLPAPDFSTFLPPDHASPQGETEIMLAAIWKDVLKVDRVGRADDFFDLGGHSLLATQVAARVEGQFGVRLSLVTFFEASTLAEQASSIAKQQAATTSTDELADLLDSMQSLSSDELERWLSE